MDGFWTAHVIWFLAGAVFLLAEMALPGFVLLFFALGAFAASLAAYALGLGVGGQFVVFIAASLAGLALLRRMFLRVFRGRTHSEAGGDAEPDFGDVGAGKPAVATRAMGPGKPGEIKFRGSFWRAESEETIGEGEDVVIVGQAKNDTGAYLVRRAQAVNPQQQGAS
ncbi:MAG: NfeD family protein [Desulfovibrio sp.]|jgi:membrane protein implicated in regulation of membrane protease activity